MLAGGPIVVTGASGRLGRVLCRQLLGQGIAVRPADRLAASADASPQVEAVDMLRPNAVRRLVDGARAVVHLANYSHASAAEPRTLFNENVAMNMNVFHAAAETGVHAVIFASSIQVISGGRTAKDIERPSCLPYLPLDSQTPPHPGNAYALSKYVGEITLQHHAGRLAAATAIRFPMLLRESEFAACCSRARQAGDDEVIDQGFAMLRYTDAASLIVAILSKPLLGYRVYLPAAAQNLLGQPPARVARTYYAHVPVRLPLERLDRLIDTTQITAETGWEPRTPGDAARGSAA